MSFSFTGKAAVVVVVVALGLGVVFYNNPAVLSWILSVLQGVTR